MGIRSWKEKTREGGKGRKTVVENKAEGKDKQEKDKDKMKRGR